MAPVPGRGATAGAAKSTRDGNTAAIKRFDAMQEQSGDPAFATLVNLDNESAEKHLNNYASCLMESTEISTATKLGYTGKIYTLLKAANKDLTLWQSEEWYKVLRDALETGSNRLMMLSDEDRIDSKCLPFYMVVKDDYVSERLRKDIIDHCYSDGKQVYAQDGQSLCARLLKELVRAPNRTRGPAQKRVWYLLCAFAVGRGGEIKFQRYDDWYFDQNFQNVDATWSELKTLTRHAMLFGPMKYGLGSYLCDFYHAFGTFFAVEDGLARNGLAEPLWKYVFPQLAGCNHVAKLVTDLIRDHANPAVKDRYSSKSIRKAMTTFLQYLVSEIELEIRGGWHPASTSKSYRESNVGLTMPSINAMNGWTDIYKKKLPPRLECFEASTQPKLERLLDEFFIVHVPAFQKDGHLRPFLRTCLASILMYHEDYEKDYGSRNLLVLRLYQAARKADISEPGYATPDETIRFWGKVIKVDFLGRNLDGPDIDNSTYVEILQSQKELNKELVARVSSLEAGMQQRDRADEEQRATQCATLNAILQELRKPGARRSSEGRTHSTRVTLSPFVGDQDTSNVTVANNDERKIPPSISDRDMTTATVDNDEGRKCPPSIGVQDTSSATVVVDKGCNFSPSIGYQDVATSSVATVSRKRPPSDDRPGDALRFVKHSKGMDVATGASMVGVSVSTLIADYLYNPSDVVDAPEGKYFFGEQQRLLTMKYPALGERDKLKLVMELVEFVITKEQWQGLCTDDLSRDDLNKVTMAIENQCMKTMLALEKDREVTEDELEKSNCQPAFIGLGSRVRKYLNKKVKAGGVKSLRGSFKQANTIVAMFANAKKK
jgi:hypothetical protein